MTTTAQQQAAILRLYERAEKRVTDYVFRRLAKGMAAPDWALVKTLELQETKRWIMGKAAPTKKAQRQYAKLLANSYRAVNSGGLVHAYSTERAVMERIAHNTPLMMPDFERAAMRAVEDVYRTVITGPAGDMALGAVTRRDALEDALTDFRKQGVTAFIDRGGRRWNIKTYADMALRTGTRNARRAAHLDRFTEKGVDLVKVSSAPDGRSGGKTCSKCAPWEGKVLSISGTTEGYPTLKQAESAGLHHPNCRHTVAAYLDAEADAAAGSYDALMAKLNAKQP